MTGTHGAHRARPDADEPTSMATGLWRSSLGGRQRQTSTVMWSALFTAVQAWALLAVLMLVHPQGVAHVALACAMAGAVTAVILAWERRGPRRHSTPGRFGDQTDPPQPPQRDTVRLRGRAKR